MSQKPTKRTFTMLQIGCQNINKFQKRTFLFALPFGISLLLWRNLLTFINVLEIITNVVQLREKYHSFSKSFITN